MYTACVTLDILDLFVQAFAWTIALAVFPAVLDVLPVMPYRVGSCSGGRARGSGIATEPFGQGSTLECILGKAHDTVEFILKRGSDGVDIPVEKLDNVEHIDTDGHVREAALRKSDKATVHVSGEESYPLVLGKIISKEVWCELI